MAITTISGNVTWNTETTIPFGDTLRFDPAVSGSAPGQGTLPFGVELDFDEGLGGSIGTLAGTPIQRGRYGFTLQVQDTDGHSTERSFLVPIYGRHRHH